MSPKPFTENDPREYDAKPEPLPCGCEHDRSECECDTSCSHCWPDSQEDPLGPARGIINGIVCSLVIFGLLAGIILLWPTLARARVNSVQPVAAPQSLLDARSACPNDASIVKCRTALRHALEAVHWQRHARHQAARKTYPGDAAAAITLACDQEHMQARCGEFFTVAWCESRMHPLDQLGQFKGLFQLGAMHREDPVIRLLGWDDPYASALHTVRFVKAHGWSQWQCRPDGGLRW